MLISGFSGCVMIKYFFDLATKSYVQYDYRGRDLERPELAREMAELIALDIECTDGDDFAGAEVQVRNIGGQKLFSVPVRETELIAA
jgi:hypothetical protein